ncbi:MAG: hypothetical protein P0Y64_17560 [Candidatus Sphingomonas colombiensis]|nr:hypothetical protein [Sphingomonas sp.]WEK43113.1 MAG: hypothetical protein P0Y64_17560 [Sphingomonas sp.]
MAAKDGHSFGYAVDCGGNGGEITEKERPHGDKLSWPRDSGEGRPYGAATNTVGSHHSGRPADAFSTIAALAAWRARRYVDRFQFTDPINA